MTDDRIHQYLADRADAIELRPTDPSAIVKRAHSRRQRRRAGAIALCALAIGASAVVVTQRDDPESETSTASSGVVESTFDWAVVEPSAGLGYSTSSALTDDGVIYSLSTAPGQMDTGGNPWAEPATLYRSGDGAEWTEVDLPGDLWASALAGAGDRLYAVGTAPAGGGAVYQVATSDDGGQSWTETEVPSELTDLQQRLRPRGLHVEAHRCGSRRHGDRLRVHLRQRRRRVPPPRRRACGRLLLDPDRRRHRRHGRHRLLQ